MLRAVFVFVFVSVAVSVAAAHPVASAFRLYQASGLAPTASPITAVAPNAILPPNQALRRAAAGPVTAGDCVDGIFQHPAITADSQGTTPRCPLRSRLAAF